MRTTVVLGGMDYFRSGQIVGRCRPNVRCPYRRRHRAIDRRLYRNLSHQPGSHHSTISDSCLPSLPVAHDRSSPWRYPLLMPLSCASAIVEAVGRVVSIRRAPPQCRPRLALSVWSRLESSVALQWLPESIVQVGDPFTQETRVGSLGVSPGSGRCGLRVRAASSRCACPPIRPPQELVEWNSARRGGSESS
jgi:hypothetical protein